MHEHLHGPSNGCRARTLLIMVNGNIHAGHCRQQFFILRSSLITTAKLFNVQLTGSDAIKPDNALDENSNFHENYLTYHSRFSVKGKIKRFVMTAADN